MKTLKIVGTILTALIIFVVTNTFAADHVKIDAKKLFTDKKCNSCHSVVVESIEKTNKNSKAPDLSDGSLYKADFLTKYLNKEESINDKKHGIALRGTPEEIIAMVTWLTSLKAPDPTPAK